MPFSFGLRPLSAALAFLGGRIGGAVLFLHFASLIAFGAPNAVVFNEIHYQPANKTKLEKFIELHNPGAVSLDVGGWSISDGVDFTFPAGTKIDAGGFIVVAESPPAF